MGVVQTRCKAEKEEIGNISCVGGRREQITAPIPPPPSTLLIVYPNKALTIVVARPRQLCVRGNNAGNVLGKQVMTRARLESDVTIRRRKGSSEKTVSWYQQKWRVFTIIIIGHTLPHSMGSQSMIIQVQLCSQTILHRSPTVLARGPWVAM